MKRNPLYQQLRQIALAGNYTREQIAAVTKGQMVALLGMQASELPDAIFENLKGAISRRLQERDDLADKNFILDQIDGDQRVAFRARFPDFEVKWQRQGEYRSIVLLLDGIPEEPA